MIFKNLWAFLFLIPLAYLVIRAIWKDQERSGSLQVSSLKVLASGGKPLRSRLKFLPLALKTIGLILAIVALARPQSVSNKTKRNVEGIDISIALDISDSMLIEDMKPNRIEAAKQMIRQFVQNRVSDRIGLLVFAGESYTRVPLTTDYKVLLKSVDEVKEDHIMKMGTAIGVALANAVARLKDSTAKSRIIIFMTDGENNAGTIDPEVALEVAKGFGIKIYTIGIGKDGLAQLPVYVKDYSGRTVKTYQPMESRVNDDLLGKMAKETGGIYYRAEDTPSLKQVFQKIDSLEKSKIDAQQYTKYEELFETYLFWAGILYAIGALLGRTWLRRAP